MAGSVNDDRPDPFEQLVRSHRRLEERLATLVTIAGAESVDEGAVRDVSEFLARQGKRHEEDEEESLFPRLAQVADLAGVLAQLSAEHVAHRQLHARLESVVQALDAAPATPATRAELVQVAEALEDAYRTHIDVEEAVLFPAARRVLDPHDLEAISASMQARRGRGGDGGGRRRDRR